MKLIYNHDIFYGYGSYNGDCFIILDRLYKYKCYYIYLHYEIEGNENDEMLNNSELINFLMEFNVIHESHFDFMKEIYSKN